MNVPFASFEAMHDEIKNELTEKFQNQSGNNKRLQNFGR